METAPRNCRFLSLVVVELVLIFISARLNCRKAILTSAWPRNYSWLRKAFCDVCLMQDWAWWGDYCREAVVGLFLPWGNDLPPSGHWIGDVVNCPAFFGFPLPAVPFGFRRSRVKVPGPGRPDEERNAPSSHIASHQQVPPLVERS